MPRQVHVERQIEIERPAATVFGLLDGFRMFNAWSPWAEKDPAAQYTISGPPVGVGARIDWRGDPRLVGTGWQQITESHPYSLLRMHLDFGSQGAAESYFMLDPRQRGVLLTWGFDTDMAAGDGWFDGLLARYFGLFFDRWIGPDHEQGLTRLKALAESLPATDFSGLDAELLQIAPIDVLYRDRDLGDTAASLGAGVTTAIAEIRDFMDRNGIEAAGPPMVIRRGQQHGGPVLNAALPVSDDGTLDSGPGSAIRRGQVPGGLVLRAIYRGPYAEIAQTYPQLSAWMAAHGYAEGPVSWEQYVSPPGEGATDTSVTHIYIQVNDEPDPD